MNNKYHFLNRNLSKRKGKLAFCYNAIVILFYGIGLFPSAFLSEYKNRRKKQSNQLDTRK